MVPARSVAHMTDGRAFPLATRRRSIAWENRGNDIQPGLINMNSYSTLTADKYTYFTHFLACEMNVIFALA